MKYKNVSFVTVVFWGVFIPNLACLAQGTAFTYQGRLNDGANPANGRYDVRFALYDDAYAGAQQGDALTNAATVVTDGWFTTTIDFGNQFSGANRWLELGVRTNGGTTFTTLAPRQALTPTPYAIQAGSASAVGAENITGTIPLAQLPANVVTDGASGVNLTGTFSGSGAGLTGINLLYANSYGAFTLTTNYDGGNFALIGSPAAGSGPQSVTTADVNGDGRVDVISANASGSSLSVLTNDGSGSFTLADTLMVGIFPASVTTADVNEDGKVDLISSVNGYDSLSILTNNGMGVFVVATTPFISDPEAVRAVDVNGDGKVDLVCVNASVNTLTVLTNNGMGNFILSSTPVTGNSPRGLATADVNGDGKVDLINGGLNVSALSVLTNNGSGSFTLASSPGVGTWPVSVVARDVNGDGKMDLISADLLAGISVLTNDGSGNFSLATFLNIGTGPRDITAADVNGDGKVDLISANQDADTLSVLTNSGGGRFTLVSSPVVGDRPLSVVAADVNGDGATDLISGNSAANSLSILLNTPFFNSAILAGTFQGNGAGVSNVNAATLSGISSAGFWQAGGNAGTTPGTHFLGTTDNQPLDFRVNNLRGLRLEYANDGILPSVNVIGGSPGNAVSNGVVGATIAGGGTTFAGSINSVFASFGSIGGGSSNSVSGFGGTVAGGADNRASGSYGAVGGGQRNSASGQNATVAGGERNTASGGLATVPGGSQNTASAFGATVSGGRGNVAHWDFGTVGGGTTNKASGEYATVPGGRENTASHYAFAAGRRAKASHTGAFVWADSQDADFGSTAANQLLIRASGGVGIGMNSPQAMLHVNGDIRWGNGSILSSDVSVFRSGSGTTLAQFDATTISLNSPTRILGNNNWGVTGGEGDFRVGNDTYRFKIGVANAGGGAGAVWMRAHGGVQQINIKAPGGTWFISNEAETAGVSLPAGGTAWAVASDRNLKKDFAPVDTRDILEKLAAMPITQWHYQWEEAATTPHIGPTAQDFKAAFYPGTDDKSITTQEADGVALAAIQGLNQKLEETRVENAQLKERLAQIEQLVLKLTSKGE